MTKQEFTVPGVEFIGAYEGIKYAVLTLQVATLWVEGDSTIIIRELSSLCVWAEALLVKIREWNNQLHSFLFSYIYREGNTRAD